MNFKVIGFDVNWDFYRMKNSLHDSEAGNNVFEDVYELIWS